MFYFQLFTHKYARRADFLKIKVLISRAVAQKSEILLLDDPFSRLPPEDREVIVNILKDLNQRLGCTVIVAVPRLSQIEEKSSLRIINIEDTKDLQVKEKSVADIHSNDNLNEAKSEHFGKAKQDGKDKKIKIVISNLIRTNKDTEEIKECNGIIYSIATELKLPFEIGEGKVVPQENSIKEKISIIVESKYLKLFKDYLEKRSISFELC